MNENVNIVMKVLDDAEQPTKLAVDLMEGSAKWFARVYGAEAAAERLYRMADELAVDVPKNPLKKWMTG